MVLKDVITKENKNAFMLCNEAIVRGALEADVKVVAFYPGAPASEALDTFSDALGNFDYQMEIATNEKVALEVCAGASFAGESYIRESISEAVPKKTVEQNMKAFDLGKKSARDSLCALVPCKNTP